jgi:thiamine pyrophosphate-dependent acetolactate synthase large subunit-like protein
VIHFEIDPAEVDKKRKDRCGCNGDVREALAALLP